jgi:uncharacterized protein YbaR (Trm112 family)
MNQEYKQQDFVVCPSCKQTLIYADGSLICGMCSLKFRIHGSIPVLLVSEAEHIHPDADRQK